MKGFNLKINNLYSITSADINFNKITVVAGKNASGKSIISKLLFCFMYANSKSNMIKRYDSYINNKNSILENVLLLEFGKFQVYNNNLAIVDFEKKLGNDLFSYNLIVGSEDINLKIVEENVFPVKYDNVIYLSSLSLFDLKESTLFDADKNTDTKYEFISTMYHTDYLFNILRIKKDNHINENSIKIQERIKKLIGGEFDFDDENLKFVFKSDDINLDMINVSSCFKQLGLIQLLLKNGQLTENSVLIIDNPELNLHPDLQIKFVELIIYIAKIMKIPIYLNSCSPYIIEALEVFSLKENMCDDISYNLCEESENDGFFNITNIPSDELNEIYNDLAKPYSYLNNLRFEYEWENDLI